jgi:predicted transcriptional regulator
MASILELVSDIVSSHASVTAMTSDELVQEIQKVHAMLVSLEAAIEVIPVEEGAPVITLKQAFKKDEVICMVCGKGGMKTLARHLMQKHDMKPGAYRKQFNIPSKQSLTAKSFSDARKKFAHERGLGDQLVKAREVRMAKLKGKKVEPIKAAKTKTIKKSK